MRPTSWSSWRPSGAMRPTCWSSSRRSGTTTPNSPAQRLLGGATYTGKCSAHRGRAPALLGRRHVGDWHVEPVLQAPGEVLVQPSGQVGGERQDDDLVEVLSGHRGRDRVNR